MSDIIFPSPVRAVDGNGNPVPGARAYFYASGTSTPATVFADASESVAHPSPLVADAAGVFPPVYSGGQPLRVLVTDADGVTLPGFPIDPVLTAPAGGGAAQTISFDPTPQIPVTNVQAAIEQVQANLVAPLLAGGIGVVGNADVLANLDATNTPSGFYRWTDTATGTHPTGWSGETGIVYLLRETASNALQFIARRDIQQIWWRRLTEGAWSSWRPLARYVTDPTDEGDTVPALWSGADVAAMVADRLNASGSAPMFATRAWGKVDGSGTLSAGGNIASVTRQFGSVGRYTVTFTTAMPTADYAVTGSAYRGGYLDIIFLVESTSTTGFEYRLTTGNGDARDGDAYFSVVC